MRKSAGILRQLVKVQFRIVKSVPGAGATRREPPQLGDLIQLIEETVGMKAELKTLPAQQGDMRVTYADITKAQRMLKYRPTTPLKAGLKKFVEWFRTSERGVR